MWFSRRKVGKRGVELDILSVDLHEWAGSESQPRKVFLMEMFLHVPDR